jgi:hypothetical protein
VNFFGDRWLYIEVNGFLWILLACVVRGQMIENQCAAEALTANAAEAPVESGFVEEEEPALAL